jgi:ribosomal protein L37AE/L43A
MATVASLRESTGLMCEKCGEPLVAPDWAEYFSEENVILNLWSCTNCGYRFETEAVVPADSPPQDDGKAVEEFFSSLLVA